MFWIRTARQRIAYSLAAITASAIVVFLLLPQSSHYHAQGPMNIGHENLNCSSCHDESTGTLRQRLQYNVRYLLGINKQPVPLGYAKVTNKVCLDCHTRPNDRHPVFRFNEPKYIKARQKIAPQFCNSCHLEHQHKRVTAKQDYCKQCHEDLKLTDDPLDIPHARLVKQDKWTSCLGCHDFHGNHKMKLKNRFSERLSPATIKNYFESSDSPYGKEKWHKAKERRNES